MAAFDPWRAVRAQALHQLDQAVPDMPFEDRVRVAEDAAREVSDAIKAWNEREK